MEAENLRIAIHKQVTGEVFQNRKDQTQEYSDDNIVCSQQGKGTNNTRRTLMNGMSSHISEQETRNLVGPKS